MLGNFQLAGLNEKTDRNPSLSVVNLKHGLKPAQPERKALMTPGSLHANHLRGDQGVDALHYTERTGTASNRRPRSYLVRCGRGPVLPLLQRKIAIRGSSVSLVLAVAMGGLLHALHQLCPCPIRGPELGHCSVGSDQHNAHGVGY